MTNRRMALDLERHLMSETWQCMLFVLSGRPKEARVGKTAAAIKRGGKCIGFLLRTIGYTGRLALEQRRVETRPTHHISFTNTDTDTYMECPNRKPNSGPRRSRNLDRSQGMSSETSTAECAERVGRKALVPGRMGSGFCVSLRYRYCQNSTPVRASGTWPDCGGFMQCLRKGSI
jgi:hypothetical protein